MKDHFVPHKKQKVFAIVKPIFKLFFRRPKEIRSLTGEVPARAILVANHATKRGPMIYTLHLPTYHRPWGAHQMLGNYSSRFHYLRDVFYIQKRGFGRFRATLLASFEAIFSILLYRGMRFLPTYHDTRFAKTIHASMKTLEADMQILVFPENSEDGYRETINEFFPGFVVLAEHYRRRTGVDLPIYPIYYHEKLDKILIGEPDYAGKMADAGLSRVEIAEEFRKKVNALCEQIVTESAAE